METKLNIISNYFCFIKISLGHLVEEEHRHEDEGRDSHHREVQWDAQEEDDDGAPQPEGVVGEQPLDVPPKLRSLTM